MDQDPQDPSQISQNITKTRFAGDVLACFGGPNWYGWFEVLSGTVASSNSPARVIWLSRRSLADQQILSKDHTYGV